MMKSKDCSICLYAKYLWAIAIGLGLLSTTSARAQYRLAGRVLDGASDKPIKGAEVYDERSGEITLTDKKGFFYFEQLPKGLHDLVIFAYQYEALRKNIILKSDTTLTFVLKTYSKELSEVVIRQKREEVFTLSRLKPVEGTAIYAGKKTEVVLLDQVVGNLASNNARQVYGQVVGLNIYENSDAGLQLNIGGRGLDPNRTANFNTRQNGYDISADVLGYPESYYTPPAEALQEIQVIRGAASLQYGTQFGGLINFKIKPPSTAKKLKWTSRQSLGSFGLLTSFNSLSGTAGKFSYFGYFHHKQGNGFRPNAQFDSNNAYFQVNYRPSEKTSIGMELTYLHYLAQQAGGLTDTQFKRDPTFSNRERNWFEVDWKLYALKLKHKFTARTSISVTLFGLDAERNALGFRGNLLPTSNPVQDLDIVDSDRYEFTRDLIVGEFNNWGAEARILSRYRVGSKDAVFLIGSKYYRADNVAKQGAGSNDNDTDFQFATAQFPDYPNQSEFDFPNRNVSLFGENIFFLSPKLSITPGFRFEHINTASEGDYLLLTLSDGGQVLNRQVFEDNRSFDRNFVLLGLGGSYQYSKSLELYANLSQNYRSVTFNDIRTVNPTFIIDPNISDESGFTGDLGIRGQWEKFLSYDFNGFAIAYNDRIGTIFESNRADRIRKNIGDAFIYGLELFADWNMAATLGWNTDNYRLHSFINSAYTRSEYVRTEDNNVLGRQVEFIPDINVKTGLSFGFRNLLSSLQFTYLSQQYTDAENSLSVEDGDSRSGIIGEIPPYGILDVSLSYSYGKWKAETGINNLLDESYFTRRATGYPGPGIIPSDPRSYYFTLEFKL